VADDRSVGRSAVVSLYRAGASVAAMLPDSVGIAAGRALGRASRHVMPGRRRMITRHLERASNGELQGLALRRAVAGAFDSYGRYWYELLVAPHDVRAGRISERVRLDGIEHIEDALAEGSGAVMALPHLGGWEYAGAYIAELGMRPLAVAEPLEPPELFEWFAEQRAAMGIEVVALGPEAVTRLVAALRDNRVVTLVCDRDLTGDGVEVSFFGERTTVPGGPALLALRTGARLLPVATYFHGRFGHRAAIRPPVPVQRTGKLRDDVTRVTQALVGELEDLIRAKPEQWHLLQPNWPSDFS
jgi:KDO2-lipid IV(A) lauroyltransferase